MSSRCSRPGVIFSRYTRSSWRRRPPYGDSPVFVYLFTSLRSGWGVVIGGLDNSNLLPSPREVKRLCLFLRVSASVCGPIRPPRAVAARPSRLPPTTRRFYNTPFLQHNATMWSRNPSQDLDGCWRPLRPVLVYTRWARYSPRTRWAEPRPGAWVPLLWPWSLEQLGALGGPTRPQTQQRLTCTPQRPPRALPAL